MLCHLADFGLSWSLDLIDSIQSERVSNKS